MRAFAIKLSFVAMFAFMLLGSAIGIDLMASSVVSYPYSLGSDGVVLLVPSMGISFAFFLAWVRLSALPDPFAKTR